MYGGRVNHPRTDNQKKEESSNNDIRVTTEAECTSIALKASCFALAFSQSNINKGEVCPYSDKKGM